MAIEDKSSYYSSHKHKYNVYVDLNSKTKLGEDLLDQYRKESKYHYMDIGRIGYHDEYGKYIIDNYTVKELIVVPKLIIRVTERAFDRAGRDVYQLRTYMSKFGQLNFLLLVDRDKADLMLVENIYIENLNHKEDYETLLWRLSYYNQKPVPLKEIFYKFGIRANPDDYGKSWKEEDISINNILVSKAKAEMTKQIANKVASEINQKVLVTSLNYLNKEGDYGKKITKAYSSAVAKKPEINKLATSQKLENTLNHVLLKTVEDNTTKKDLRDKTTFRVYKKVLDVELSCPNEVAQTVKLVNSKQNLKQFLLENYQNSKAHSKGNFDENQSYIEKQNEFEKIINYKYDKTINKEDYQANEEKFDAKSIKGKNKFELKDFKDFDGKKVEVNLEAERFNKPEDKNKKKQRLKKEQADKKQQRKEEKILQKRKRLMRALNAECNIDSEFEKSKTVLGLTPNDSKRKKRKVIADFFNEKKDKNKKLTKEEKQKQKEEKKTAKENILSRLEKRVKRETSKKEDKKVAREEKKKAKSEERLNNKQKEKTKKVLFENKKEEKKTKTHLLDDRPVVKEKPEKEIEKGTQKVVVDNKYNLKENKQEVHHQNTAFQVNSNDQSKATIYQSQPQHTNVGVQPQVQSQPEINVQPQPQIQPKQEQKFDFANNKMISTTKARERTMDM